MHTFVTSSLFQLREDAKAPAPWTENRPRHNVMMMEPNLEWGETLREQFSQFWLSCRVELSLHSAHPAVSAPRHTKQQGRGACIL